jgi:AraC-like DNA-binding protein
MPKILNPEFSLTSERVSQVFEKVSRYREKNNLSWDELADEFGIPKSRLYRFLYYGTGLTNAPMIMRLMDMDWGITREDLDYDD